MPVEYPLSSTALSSNSPRRPNTQSLHRPRPEVLYQVGRWGLFGQNNRAEKSIEVRLAARDHSGEEFLAYFDCG